MNKKLKPYETDASQIEGNALKVEQPETLEGVQRVIRMNKRICIRGGGSGLAGGAVPLNGVDTVLDISKLDKIISLDKERKIVEVEAGVILDDLQNYLDDSGLEFPVNPSSCSIATIGGMIATNAVGNRAIKYGKTSDWISWIDVVGGGGHIERKTQTELSDYVGMEGITGVIVKAGLRLSPKKIRSADLVSFKDYRDVIAEVLELKRNSSVSMVELMSKQVSKMLDLGDEYNLLVEYESDVGSIKGKNYEMLLKTRRKIGPYLSQEGKNILEDPKVMASKSGRLVEWFEENEIPFFGHIGVGIFHPRFKENQKNLIPEMMKIVKQLGGSVSGEHGIGLLKREFVDVNDKKIIQNIKKRTDKSNKFNVGKVI